MAGGNAVARTCSANDFGDIVDSAGANLRTLNADQQPRLEQALKDLKRAQNWSDAEYTDRARQLVQDEYVQRLDRDASELLARIERLGSAGANGEAPDCDKLDELRAEGAELSRVMRSKWAYAFGKVEAAIAEADAGPVSPGGKATAEAAPESDAGAAEGEASATLDAAKETLAVKPEISADWKTVAIPDAMFEVPDSPPATTELSSANPLPPQSDFSMDEIQGASKGFFGSVSKELAAVIEYAFGKLGRPTGYILGNDGGGAVVAGVRYGKGRIYTAAGAYRIYWQGPSLGFDFGVEGSKTLMLVYNLKRPDDALSKFGGVAGSAYVVGGVGVTFLTDGDVVVAPIRSGVGLRIGANIGYLKFTNESTWNPF